MIWKIWLILNKLTGDPNDHTAIVDTAGPTKQLDDIVEDVANESDIHRETIRAVLDRANASKGKYLQAGYAVNDGLIELSPRVQGNFHGHESVSQGDHTITLSLRLTPKLKKLLAVVKLEILGFKDSGANITIVTDLATGLQDDTITPGDDILIEGDKIKVVGEPQESGTEPGIGVFFIDDSGTKVQAIRFNENTTGRVNVRVPAGLPKGKSYTLRIVTRYTSGALLVEPRTIDFVRKVKTLSQGKK
jgi:hypothetical protein